MIYGNGVRPQNGIPIRMRNESNKPNGLLLKGVVTATYAVDSEEHPKFDDSSNPPCAIYCDVIVYTNLAYSRWFPLSKVLVSQKRGGLHDDDIWKPKASNKNIFGDFNSTTGANLGSLDGDHVLVGFINNSFDEPIILKGIPHPSRDIGNDEYTIGKRLKLKVIDGNPDFVKHNGVFRGVDDKGNYIVDTVYGNNGITDENGIEPIPDSTGVSGNQIHNLPKNSEYSINLKDITNPENPSNYFTITIQSSGNNIEAVIAGENVVIIKDKGLSTSLKLGNGAVSVAIANHLQILYNQLYTALLTHIHPIGSPNTGNPIFSSPLPQWDTNINSDRLTIPDN